MERLNHPRQIPAPGTDGGTAPLDTFVRARMITVPRAANDNRPTLQFLLLQLIPLVPLAAVAALGFILLARLN